MASLSISMSKRQKWNWKKTYGILILSAAFFTITMPLQAALLQERQYSLRQLIAFALEYNRSIQAAKYKLNASDWNVKKAYSEFLPKITLSQRFTRNDNISVRNANFAIDGLKSFPGFEGVDIPPLLFKNTFTSGFTVLMPIYNGGRLSSTLEVSKISRESDRLSVIDTEAEIKRQVTGMYFNYVKNRERIKVREKALQFANANLTNVRAKHELGLRPKSDILRWEAQVASEESSLIVTQNTAEITRLSLANLAGFNILDTIDVTDFLAEEFTANRLRYAKIADANRPELINRRYNQAL